MALRHRPHFDLFLFDLPVSLASVDERAIVRVLDYDVGHSVDGDASRIWVIDDQACERFGNHQEEEWGDGASLVLRLSVARTGGLSVRSCIGP